jgi:hypothetical protein
MPKKKSTVTGTVGVKAKGLFDHINHIREKQDPAYFKNLTDADRKSWSNYMICRFLSMQPNLIELVNEIQKYQTLDPELFYQCCIAIVPKGRAYYPYIKNSKSKEHTKELIGLMKGYFMESERNVTEYLSLMTEEQIKQIVSLFGYTEKEMEKLIGHE